MLRNLIPCLLLTTVGTACGSDDTHLKLSRRQGSNTGATTSPSRSPLAVETPPAGGLTPDQEFLHKISDHHKGMIVLAHEAIERSEPLPVKDEARSLDHRYDAALQTVETLLRVNFQDYYAAELTAEFRAKLDTLATLHGNAFVSTFRQQLRDSHQWTLRVVDEYLPRFGRPNVKAFASRMRTEEDRALHAR